MNKAELKQKLNRYNYRHKEQFEKIIVYIDSTLEIEIDYSEGDKVIIADKLRGYNILTGVWTVSVKGSIILNTALSFLYLLVYSYLNYIINKPFFIYCTLMIFVLGVGWTILWTFYYLVKAENFKTLIQSWDR